LPFGIISICKPGYEEWQQGRHEEEEIVGKIEDYVRQIE
jgi:hypothetical protein